MKKTFTLLLCIVFFNLSCNTSLLQFKNNNYEQKTKLHYIRQATSILEISTKKIIIDPVFAQKGVLAPIPFSNNKRNPLNNLPISKEKILKNTDAILLTHYHPDHFDSVAENTIPKNMKIFCQPYDKEKLQQKGFTNISSIQNSIQWQGIKMQRFKVQHHEGATGLPPFGESSAFLIEFKKQKIFISGDSILDKKLENILENTTPHYIIANTGACTFSKPNPVLTPGMHMTFTKEELINISKIIPKTKIIPIHMDAINHCGLTKKELQSYINTQHSEIKHRIIIPKEGETLTL
ncbi:L-ascorbate metabolism protein UlaG, beta-lactamase superfamily [Tenacibaculum sp. 190524A02b]|uniref:L-ascorbate metabolism protein UlaG, beta-lactamase superfamily n=1 Tax=Tenacibaculum vairaonense TaxID=3137860 RepID=A0ABM9PKK8_9FLAO